MLISSSQITPSPLSLESRNMRQNLMQKHTEIKVVHTVCHQNIAQHIHIHIVITAEERMRPIRAYNIFI